MQNTFNKALAIVALSTIAGTVVYAWTGPTGTAPNNNVAAPINVSSNAQTKAGALTVDSLTTSGVGGIQNNSQASYGPVKLESWGIGNTGGSGNIYMEPKPGSTFYIVPNDWSNNLTTHIRGKIEFGSGSETTYGAVTMKGEKSGWSGINFKNGSWANSGTLMMHPSYSGFYNNNDTNWRWYTDNSGNSYQPGIGQATDFCVYGTSKCLSSSASVSYVDNKVASVGTVWPTISMANLSAYTQDDTSPVCGWGTNYYYGMTDSAGNPYVRIYRNGYESFDTGWINAWSYTYPYPNGGCSQNWTVGITNGKGYLQVSPGVYVMRDSYSVTGSSVNTGGWGSMGPTYISCSTGASPCAMQ